MRTPLQQHSLVLLLILSAGMVRGNAQPSMLAGPFDPSIPPPAAVLGFELGERFTDFRLLEAYTEAVAAASPRVRLITYGSSYEHRPLRVLVITSPANHNRLEEIRASNVRLTDPRSLSATEADKITSELPAIVWLSYGVHGNESSSSEAAMAVLYKLAAGTDRETTEWLDHLVVILDPLLNPDGRERYVRWANGSAQSPPNTDPLSYEHTEDWPGGRTNHYYFDLNRDWSWATQKESRARLALYESWMPHTHVDFHEMGYESSYFFFPATKPFHEVLPPTVQEWGAIYGKGNALALDSIGSSYFTGELFDMFYPGYGDSWPTFNGGIGMTYEQAGGGAAGLGIKRKDQTTLLLIDRIRNHVTTSLATLRTTMRNRGKRLSDFASFWRSAGTDRRGSGTVIVPGDQDPSLLFRFSDVLMQQGIEVHRLSKPERLTATPFYARTSGSVLVPEGTLLVSLSQPRSRLASALLEPKTSARDTFFYDVSAWSLPVAYGLRAYQGGAGLPPSAEQLKTPAGVSGRVIGAERAVAFVIPWDRQTAAPLIIRLLTEQVRLRQAHKPFTIDGRTFSQGTIVIPAAQDIPDLRRRLADHAAALGVDIYAVTTGLTENGISLGSNYIRPLRLPTIGIFTGDGVSAGDYGELWYLFEQELHLPFSPLAVDKLAGMDLDRYDVLIFPSGYRWKVVLDSATTAGLKSWVSKGGVVIGLEEAARAMTVGMSRLTPAVLAGQEKKETKDEKDKEKEDPAAAQKELFKTLSNFGKEEYNRLNRIPGSIFEALIDTTHPVGFGTSGRMFVLKGNGIPFALTSEGHTIARFTADTVQVSGYLPQGRGKQIANSAYIQEYRLGRGRVVLFSESMTFRMFWRGPAKLLVNSILFLHEPRVE